MTPIVFGMPGPELVAASVRGEVELGGCLIEDEAPMFVCGKCGRTVGRLGDVMDEHLADDTWLTPGSARTSRRSGTSGRPPCAASPSS